MGWTSCLPQMKLKQRNRLLHIYIPEITKEITETLQTDAFDMNKGITSINTTYVPTSQS